MKFVCECRPAEIRVAALMILSLLSTEKEAKSLLNASALSLLVGYLAKCVRQEIPMDTTKWAHTRRARIISTLEKMITSEESLVAALLQLDIVALLKQTLDTPDSERCYATEEACAVLTCLWTQSENETAKRLISSDTPLVTGTHTVTNKINDF